MIPPRPENPPGISTAPTPRKPCPTSQADPSPIRPEWQKPQGDGGKPRRGLQPAWQVLQSGRHLRGSGTGRHAFMLYGEGAKRANERARVMPAILFTFSVRKQPENAKRKQQKHPTGYSTLPLLLLQRRYRQEDAVLAAARGRVGQLALRPKTFHF